MVSCFKNMLLLWLLFHCTKNITSGRPCFACTGRWRGSSLRPELCDYMTHAWEKCNSAGWNIHIKKILSESKEVMFFFHGMSQEFRMKRSATRFQSTHINPWHYCLRGLGRVAKTWRSGSLMDPIHQNSWSFAPKIAGADFMIVIQICGP